MSVTIAVQLDAVQALAAELAALSAELADDAALCRSTAASLAAAVDGAAGARAGEAGAGWAALADLLAQGVAAVAGTLHEAVRAYRLADAALSDRLLAARYPGPAR